MMMANVVEITLKIYVDDLGEPLHQPVDNSIQCLMSRTFGPVSERALVKIGFKDRLQDKLQGSLNNSILNGGNSEPAGLAIPFGHLYRPVLARLVPSCVTLPWNISAKFA